MIPCGCFIADLFLVQQEASAGQVTSINKHRLIIEVRYTLKCYNSEVHLAGFTSDLIKHGHYVVHVYVR